MRLKSRIGILIVPVLLLGLIPALCNAENILIWDNDDDNIIPVPGEYYQLGYEEGFEKALTELGFEFETVSVLPTDLSDYDVMFITLGVWCTGCGSTPPSAVGTADQTRLVEFLDDGKAIYIEGVDVGSDHVGTEFFNRFGTEYVADYDGFIDAVEGVTPGLMNNLSYGVNTNDSAHQFVDVFAAGDGIAYQYMSNEGVSGVYYDSPSGYRTICTSVVFTALLEEGENTWEEMMSRYMSFLVNGDVALLGLDRESYDFEYVSIGYPETFTVTMVNNGTAMLEISEVETSQGYFYVNEDGPFILDMHETMSIEVTCMPTEPGEFNETVRFVSNDPNGDTILNLHALCIQPPTLEITPAQVNSIVRSYGQTDTVNVVFTNTGSGDLDYSVEVIDTDNFGWNRDQGGPDAFGYRWFDSNSPDGPEFVWNDIASTGTPILNWSAMDPHVGERDCGYAMRSVGFDFPYYGQTYNEMYLSPNGFICFDFNLINQEADDNYSLPCIMYPRNMVAPFWDDLNLYHGDVYIQYNDNETIIQYENANINEGEYYVTMQIVLRRGGGISFYYNEIDGSSDSATVGIDNSTGTIGLEVSYNQDYIQPGMAIAISTGPCWLDFDFEGGALEPGESVDVDAIFSGCYLPQGTYHAIIRVRSNDPVNPLIDVPVTLIVCNNEQYMVSLEVSLNSEESPTGAEASLSNQNGDPGFVYTATIPESGIIYLANVVEGSYDLHVTLDGYDEYEQTGIAVEQDTELAIEMIETLNLPVNLDVDETTSGVVLTWDAPGSRSLQSFNVYLDGELRGNTTDEQFLWIDVPVGLHTLGVTCVYTTGESDPAEIDHEWLSSSGADIIPVSDTFAGIYPNPFNPSTTFRFGIAHEERVVLEIYNVRGQLVQRLDQGRVKAGWHEATWNGTDMNNGSVGSGIFLVRLKAGSYSEVKRAVMLK